MRAVNLIPSEERGGVGGLGKGRSDGAAYIVLALLAALAVLALLYGIARHQVSSRRSQLATIAAQTQRAQEASSSLSPYTSFLALREQRVQAVEQLVDSRFDWAHAIHELGRVMPMGTQITSLNGTVGSQASGTKTASSASGPAVGASISSVTPPGSVPTMTLGGCALGQSYVAVALERLRLIDGVDNVTLQSSAKGAGAGSSATPGAGGGASGQCTGTAFTAQVTFEALPSGPSTSASSTELTSSGGGQ
jgi:hypothetical protein